MKYLYLTLLCLIFNIYSINAQQFPGGVTDVEVWYIGNWDDIGNGIFANTAQTDIKLKHCSSYKQQLFNFNASIYSESLCLRYNAPLENTIGRDVFFVGEPNKLKPSYSHLGTQWNSSLNDIAETDSIVRNFVDLNNKNLFGREIYDEYQSDKNANVNFYHSNNYNIDKKFKSYGQLGETTFYIGSKTVFDPQASYPDNHFAGNFPEFISFTRELSYNERNRVESYLALKYGLTLDKNVSYLDSENRIFWNKLNNEYFPFRIFGFGKDNTSFLNQLQSQSTHLTKHLIAAIGSIEDTNMEKQETVDIRNRHFLVFGDNNGKTDLSNVNIKQVKYWDKVWLAQRTGKEVSTFPISFELQLTEEMVQYLSFYDDESLWLLQDKYVENNEISNFHGENIQYYPAQVNLNQGVAYFSNVHFDSDVNLYDQFTFGVGPSMIVQAQINGCAGDDLEITVNIAGGEPSYSIYVTSEEGSWNQIITNTSITFEAVEEVQYDISVIDNEGLEYQLTVVPKPWSFEVNLGPNQFLSTNNQSVILEASQGINDVNATYQWYQDGVLLPNNTSSITVTEAGYYTVLVTSGDLSCMASGGVNIYSENVDIIFSSVAGCSENFNSITIDVESGIAPFVTTVTGLNGTTNYVHSESTTIFDFPYGSYFVEVTDVAGNVSESNIVFNSPPEGLGLDIYPQLEEACNLSTPCLNFDLLDAPLFYTSEGSNITIDASIGVTNPNMTYEWYQNGQPLLINGPVITFISGDDECYDTDNNLPLFTVTMTDFATNCTATQSFYGRVLCPASSSLLVEESSDTGQQLINAQIETRSETSLETSIETLVTKVYPNPSQTNSTFTYEVSASGVFDGTVDVLTLAGSRLYTKNVVGKAKYTLPLKLSMSGMYLIKITTSTGVVKTDRIIIN